MKGATGASVTPAQRGPGVPDGVLKEQKKNHNDARALTSAQQNFAGRDTRLNARSPATTVTFVHCWYEVTPSLPSLRRLGVLPGNLRDLGLHAEVRLMLEPGESIQEVVEWLLTLRLSQYTSAFLGAGYRTLEDCRELTEERLLELKILPTGHRRRLLRSLEALGVKQLSGGEGEGEEEEEDEEAGDRRPVPYPRNIFLKDKKRGLSYQHPPLKESKDQEKSHSLPPGSGLVRAEVAPQAGCVRPPQPAPRKPENIQIWYEPPSIPPSVSSSSSGSPTSSDWDLSPGDPPKSSSDSSAAANDTGGFAGEMVENAIYEARPRSAAAAGPRPTRSYRLRHRPVPSIPSATTPLLQDRSALPVQTATAEHLAGSEAPAGANGAQKDASSEDSAGSSAMASASTRHVATRFPRSLAFFPPRSAYLLRRGLWEQIKKRRPLPLWPREGENLTGTEYSSVPRLLGETRQWPEAPLQRTSAPIVPYGELCLYNNPDGALDRGAKEVFHKGFRDKLKKKNREKAAKPKESKEDPTRTPEDEYSTVTECARILTSDGAPGEPASSGPPLGSLDMVECELYSLPTDALEDTTAAAMPDISPYACFYGAGKSPVLKAGWLDKLSPQGKCVFQRRWVRLDGESLAYYNNEKPSCTLKSIDVGTLDGKEAETTVLPSSAFHPPPTALRSPAVREVDLKFSSLVTSSVKCAVVRCSQLVSSSLHSSPVATETLQHSGVGVDGGALPALSTSRSSRPLHLALFLLHMGPPSLPL
ncbi:Arf-GAP with [Takifugu flavidus]|uniref:Arf-GAP with n=1 Tax=Takifugu flavidus TaxID=433684 RepID=A0A5C6N6Q5_9TELE|nr:Arf-GAP with [Takifugu flavidus]